MWGGFVHAAHFDFLSEIQNEAMEVALSAFGGEGFPTQR